MSILLLFKKSPGDVSIIDANDTRALLLDYNLY